MNMVVWAAHKIIREPKIIFVVSHNIYISWVDKNEVFGPALQG
jgi:hypothetical protein